MVKAQVYTKKNPARTAPSTETKVYPALLAGASLAFKPVTVTSVLPLTTEVTALEFSKTTTCPFTKTCPPLRNATWAIFSISNSFC